VGQLFKFLKSVKKLFQLFLKNNNKKSKKALHVSFLLILLVAVFKSDLAADSQSFLTFFVLFFCSDD